MSFNDRIDSLLTTLASDDSDAVERALQIYDVNDVVAVMAKRLLDAEGGGFTPARNVGQCLYNAVDQPITMSADTPVTIPWEVNQGQAALLDISTPTGPTPAADGVYAVTVTAQFNADSPPAAWFLELQMDLDWFGTPVVASAPEEPTAETLTVAQTWFTSVGSALNVKVRSTGSGTLLSAYMFVQRLT